MSLDLRKLITQIKKLDKKDLEDNKENKLEATYQLLQKAFREQEKLMQKLTETSEAKSSGFYFAIPEHSQESFDKLYPSNNNFTQTHITIASDGSQINPSGHEFTEAFLINIGIVSLPYFGKDIPTLLSSEPTIYSSLEEINLGTTHENIDDEYLVSCERTLKELEEILSVAKKYASYKIPVVVLLDGTLIHWHIERYNPLFIEQFIKRLRDVLLELKALNIPVASFLSNSRSNDLINMLRIFKCPYPQVNCKKNCSNIETQNLSCNPTNNYKTVLDRRLIEKYFTEKKSPAGTRTSLFKSNSRILSYYPDELKIYFFYINTGSEVARVELPSYVANDICMLSMLHNAVALQCKVGFGYPVVLSEAHIMAQVSKADRINFYNLIQDHFLKTKRNIIRISSKELRKRISFV